MPKTAKTQKKYSVTDRRMDGRTDGPTDRPTDGPRDGPTKRGVESRSTRLKIFYRCQNIRWNTMGNENRHPPTNIDHSTNQH